MYHILKWAEIKLIHIDQLLILVLFYSHFKSIFMSIVGLCSPIGKKMGWLFSFFSKKKGGGGGTI